MAEKYPGEKLMEYNRCFIKLSRKENKKVKKVEIIFVIIYVTILVAFCGDLDWFLLLEAKFMKLTSGMLDIIICILIGFVIIVSITGCSMLQSARDVVLGRPTQELLPETSKDQLWQTIKGMTPNWLAIPVIALGGAVMWYGAFKLGMAFVIFGSTNLFMSLATARFGFWMAVFGLIGSVAALLAGMLAKNKALKELVFGIQKIKDPVAIVDQRLNIKEILKKQTKQTKKIVAKIKTKMKLKGQI